MYLSGSRGTNTEYVFPTTYTGFGNNSLTAPDSSHTVYGGVATSKASLASTDTMSTLPIDRAVAYSEMLGGGGPVYSEVPQLQKCTVENELMYLLVIDPYQAFNLRRNTTTNDWADVQKALMTAVGKDNEFYKGGMGIWNQTVVHKHPNVIRFTDYGAGGNVSASRGLFCGTQAGVVAFGSPGQDLRFGWHEEERDNGNRLIITTHTIWGFKKVTFNGYDFGVMAVDTAATRP